MHIRDEMHNLALISAYGPPDAALLQLSQKTLKTCKWLGDANLIVINVKVSQLYRWSHMKLPCPETLPLSIVGSLQKSQGWMPQIWVDLLRITQKNDAVL